MTLSRRAALGAGFALLAGGCGPRSGSVAPARWAEPSVSPTPPSPAAPSPPTTPPAYASAVDRTLRRYLTGRTHPGYAGAVALVLEDGRTRVLTSAGHALRYRAGPVELPVRERVAMRTGSVFDLASLTKVYTAILVLQLVDRGRVALDAPVRRYLPEFTGAGKERVTVAMLLAHTGALPVGAKVTGLRTDAERWRSVLRTPLVRGGVPGTTFRYSSVGLMVLGRLVEKLTGKPLDRALRDQVTAPMGLRDTGFRPLTWLADRSRLVATDARSSRGLLRGTVHDDVANRLGGVAGHAGLFGTARDVAAIGQMLLDDGTYGGRRILSAAAVRRMRTNVNRGKPAIDAERPGRSADHGLGVEMNQPWFMGRLATPASFGHTGFTGTSLLVVPDRRLVVVLLTNRAHPNWSWSDPDVHRVALHNAIAAAR